MSLLTQRLLSASIELQDISDELQRIESGVHHDAEKIIQLNERLSDGYKLLKKHSVNTTDDLLKIQQELKQKLETFSGINADIEKLEKEMSDLYEASMQIAYIISKNRKSQIKGFATEVNSLLVKVGMPNAILKVEMQSEALSVNGIDAIQYLFDANKSNKFEQLGKVASGGELSRLMLSIKSLVAKKIDLPTLIFDEIDTGIGGEAAKQVGIIMKNLSLRHQLIVITHQAQIAAKANMHLYVHKSNIDGKVKTAVKVLNNEERVNEIAQMMSGAKPTDAALKNALEMMDE
jgi:DNA repair protein RecN (Recombination protein N)